MSPQSGLHADARELLCAWDPPDDEQSTLRETYVRFLDEHPDATSRSCLPRHLTASALVVDASRGAALLTLHGKGGFWAQTGGHAEDGDATLSGAAWREATEESGIDGLRLTGPVDLDLHPLSAAFGTCRAHLDVRWVALAPPGAREVRSPESRALRWFDLTELAADGPAEEVEGGRVVALGRLARAAVRALG